MHFQADVEGAVGQAFKDILYRSRVKFRPWLHKTMLEVIEDYPGGMLLLETYLLGRKTPLVPGEDYTPEEKSILVQRFEGLRMRTQHEWSVRDSLDDYFAPTPEKDAARERELAWATSDTLESRLEAMKWRVGGGITANERLDEIKQKEREREALDDDNGGVDVDAAELHGDPEDNVYLKDIPLEESLRTLQGIADEIEKKRESLEDPHD